MITKTVKQSGKIAMLHVCMVIFLGCFFFGVFAANLWLRDENLWMGYLFETQLKNLVNAGQNWKEIMWQILPVRLIPWGMLLVIWNFSQGKLFLNFWIGWIGFSVGFVFASCLCRYGFFGVFYMMLSGFPQILLYLTAYILLVLLWDERRNMRWNKKNQISGRVGNQRKMVLFLLLVLLDSGIYVLGIWLECSVNPWILKVLAMG
ncbi:hypothetical protein [uncultured Eubacterium sp.]|uniref:hypothetical protein n=1 Tax=uncultured Eubacterium sp. TaxID=165185 RepID=UPI0025EC41FF|nr:hypothetical protein [uncultured Eubacterium sp.]